MVLAVEMGKWEWWRWLLHSSTCLGMNENYLEGSINGVYDILRRLWLLEGMMGDWGNWLSGRGEAFLVSTRKRMKRCPYYCAFAMSFAIDFVLLLVLPVLLCPQYWDWEFMAQSYWRMLLLCKNIQIQWLVFRSRTLPQFKNILIWMSPWSRYTLLGKYHSLKNNSS